MSTINTRVLIVKGEKYISVKDFVRALNNDDLMEKCGAVMKVGPEKGETPHGTIRVGIACAMWILSGEEQDHSFRN